MSINKRHRVHKIVLFISGVVLGVYLTIAYTAWAELTDQRQLNVQQTIDSNLQDTKGVR